MGGRSFRGVSGYSRLRSPFHLQLPFCLDPSPGEPSPPGTSGSSSSSSSSKGGIRARLMPPSEAGARARAHSWGLWKRGRSHTCTCHSQLHKEGPKEQQQGFSSPPTLGTLAPGHDTGSLLRWRWWRGEQAHTHVHTHCADACLPSCPWEDWNYPCEVTSFTDCNSSIVVVGKQRCSIAGAPL